MVGEAEEVMGRSHTAIVLTRGKTGCSLTAAQVAVRETAQKPPACEGGRHLRVSL